ncbi:MAG: hypothetical protein NC117_01630 [Pseudoflavonifractor sp.]|nr:hypothetical protein [Pseudoflavonifractor sp.]
MNTFLLRWNPAISSFDDKDLMHLIEYYPFAPLNWSIWDYHMANAGDSFYMMRVGDNLPGIMMSGCFSSNPRKAQDWSGKGRPTFYCDLNIGYVADPSSMPFIPLSVLQKEIPEFGWASGHSGILLEKSVANKLDELWRRLANDNQQLFAQFYEKDEWAIDPHIESKIVGFDFYKEEIAGQGSEDYHSMDYAHDCVNLDFMVDYVNHEATLLVWFQSDVVLKIICTGLRRIKTDLDDGTTFTDWFRISGEYEGLIHVDSNGIEIICENVIFEKGPEYSEDGVPVCI